MSIIFVLIPIAMFFITVAVILFFWAVKSNQYDDLDREAVNILFDEDEHNIKQKKQLNNQLKMKELTQYNVIK
ncbi:MAG: cbb3-type cytochrome oxidase assembly protein CcoS [Psychromonas sp.]